MLVAGVFYVAQRLSAPPVQLDPVSVLIADFDNRSGDPTFEQSLEPALSIALEGASFITSFDRRQAREIARRIGSQPKLDPSTARLVAIREGIKVVVTGNIETAGTGYRINIGGEDPTGKHLWSHYVSVSSKNAVLGGVATLASDVRSSLGDTASKRERLAATETLTAGSLDAVRNYSLGQDLHSSGKFEEAIEHYRKAVQLDPNFGRAYAGWATSADHLGRKDEMAAQWKKALALVDRMTEREKYRTLGTYYLAVAQNYEKAIENYSTLVRLYPTDQSGHNNLAYAYFKVLNFGKALEEGRKALEIYPKNVLFRNNYALYAMYGGDFATASREAQTLVTQEPGFYLNYLPVAVAATANGDFALAERTYAQMEQKAGAEGASLAAMGRADLAMYRGEYAAAEAILEPAAAADEKAQNTGALAAKRIALAETYMATQRVPLALETVRKTLQGATSESVLVPAARLYLQAGKIAEASEIAATLDNLLQTQTRAYAKIIDGNIALANNRRATAVDGFREAVKLADLWMARYDMGVAYVQAAHYAEALGELEASQKRRGEATAIFLNDIPSFRYMAGLPYWLGRAQEGLGQRSAALANYKAFVSVRGGATTDPLVVDALKRSGT
jgi:tetratricopeptide (TPR) repeat protein